MAQIGWKQFSTRVDIIGLSLHEQKKRFLRDYKKTYTPRVRCTEEELVVDSEELQ